MAMTCGWPLGSHKEDGFCNQHATIVYLVEVRDVPVISVDADAHLAALPLCAAHDPATHRVTAP